MKGNQKGKGKQKKKRKTNPIDPKEDGDVDLNGCDFDDSDHDIPDLFFQVHSQVVKEELRDYLGVNEMLYGDDGEKVRVNKIMLILVHIEMDIITQIMRIVTLLLVLMKKRFPEFNQFIDMRRKVRLSISMKLVTHKVFREALRQYVIENGTDFHFLRDEGS